jgi:hypothetical protein
LNEKKAVVVFHYCELTGFNSTLSFHTCGLRSKADRGYWISGYIIENLYPVSSIQDPGSSIWYLVSRIEYPVKKIIKFAL